MPRKQRSGKRRRASWGAHANVDAYDRIRDARSEARYEDDPQAEPDSEETRATLYADHCKRIENE